MKGSKKNIIVTREQNIEVIEDIITILKFSLFEKYNVYICNKYTYNLAIKLNECPIPNEDIANVYPQFQEFIMYVNNWLFENNTVNIKFSVVWRKGLLDMYDFKKLKIYLLKSFLYDYKRNQPTDFKIIDKLLNSYYEKDK